MVYEIEDRGVLRRQQAELAIRLALEGRWEEAVRLNRAIVEAFPTDVEAYNRLGKALTELGRYAEAREAYTRALELDPNNSIARRNLSRLAFLEAQAAGVAQGMARRKLPPEMFIEETGKTGVTTLLHPNREAAARLSAGDEVFLRRSNGSLRVVDPYGEPLGEVEPRLAQRLIRLMEGGNRYVAAISNLTETGDVRVFIREVYQHPSQAGKLSFPPQPTEPFRPYVKDRLLRLDRYQEEVEEPEELEEMEEWGEEGQPTSARAADELEDVIGEEEELAPEPEDAAEEEL